MGKFVLKEINGDLFTAKTSMAHCVGADLKVGVDFLKSYVYKRFFVDGHGSRREVQTDVWRCR